MSREIQEQLESLRNDREISAEISSWSDELREAAQRLVMEKFGKKQAAEAALLGAAHGGPILGFDVAELVVDGKGTPTFWVLWSRSKYALKSLGFSVELNSGGYRVMDDSAKVLAKAAKKAAKEAVLKAAAAKEKNEKEQALVAKWINAEDRTPHLQNDLGRARKVRDDFFRAQRAAVKLQN